jgi:hypothetical protein
MDDARQSLFDIDPNLWPEVWPYKSMNRCQLHSLHDGKDISNRRRDWLYNYLFSNQQSKRLNEPFTPINKRAVSHYFGYTAKSAYFEMVLCKHESWKDFLAKQISRKFQQSVLIGQPANDSPALPHAPAAAQNGVIRIFASIFTITVIG